MTIDRKAMLDQWATSIANAAAAGALDRGKPINIISIDKICGPRAGALEIHAGLDTQRLLNSLSGSDCAIHRQFVPWSFGGEPSVYLVSRYVRCEADWPDTAAEKDIPLKDLAPYPRGSAFWIAGKSESGSTIVLSVSSTIPHWLVAGHTGSGKTYALRTILAQLSKNTGNRFVLIDGKFGEGLGFMNSLPGLVGPVAIDLASARAALAWSVEEMKRRYENAQAPRPRLIVMIDEVQELSGGAMGDPFCIEMIRRLVAQGRGADIHCILGTQHPTIESAFTDPAIRRQLVGRIALRVTDYKSSEVVVGGAYPRADRLCGAGDAYICLPGHVHRVQMAYVPKSVLEAMNTSQPDLAEWPEPSPLVGGTVDKINGFSGAEIAVSITNAADGRGRPSLLRSLEAASLGVPGTDRAVRLMGVGREISDWLKNNGWEITRKGQVTAD